MSGGAGSGDHLGDCCDPLLFPVGRYVEQYGDGLDDMRFSAMHLAGGVP